MNDKRVAISDEVKAILNRGRVEENAYFLPAMQLDRSMYVEVNKILELSGGKWSRSKKAHIFESAEKARAIRENLETGNVLDRKATYQFFETPKDVARQMVELANIKNGMMILEPSAGHGAIAEAIASDDNEAPHYCNGLIMVEIDPVKCKVLEEKKIASVICADFLGTFADEYGQFDRIIMNPPFTKGQDADHVLHAFEKCLYPGGRLVSIMSASVTFNQQKRYQKVRDLVEQSGQLIELPERSFKESGTNVNAVIVVLDKSL